MIFGLHSSYAVIAAFEFFILSWVLKYHFSKTLILNENSKSNDKKFYAQRYELNKMNCLPHFKRNCF